MAKYTLLSFESQELATLRNSGNNSLFLILNKIRIENTFIHSFNYLIKRMFTGKVHI